MNREQRMRRLAALKSVAQAEGDFDFGSIPHISAAGQFGNHEILRTDFDLQFESQDLDELFMQAANKEWITIPDESRRLNIPHLYYLNPAKATKHEMYFGVKTEYGFLHTPATSALLHAAVRGSVPRRDMSEMVTLEVPAEYRGSVGSDKLYTLDSAGEQTVIGQSVNFLLRSKNRPELMRRFKVDPRSQEVEMTTSHSRGLVREPGMGQVSEKVDKKLDLLERGFERGLDSYPLLERTINTFMGTLSNRMDRLLSEQRNVNRAIRFEGKKEEMDDIVRQNILRLLMDALRDENSPLSGTEVYEQDYKII